MKTYFVVDNLPSWLEPKTEIKTTVSVLATDNNLRSQHNMLGMFYKYV